MFVPLPNLDDRRWSDLVDEGRALIPVYSPGWTDHNESDPGITMLELLAWIAEGDIYRTNRVPDSHLLAFLALIGAAPCPPAAAVAATQFILKSGQTSQFLPAGVELDAAMLDGKRGKFHLSSHISVLPVAISTVQVESGGKFRDATADWNHGKPIAIFGDNPQPGDALYLGLKGTIAPADALRLYFEFQGDGSTRAERQRILDELQSRMQACSPWDACGPQARAPSTPELPPHHAAQVVWEAQIQPGVWQQLEAVDDTRSVTLTGSVELTIGTPPVAARTGLAAAPLSYIRARFSSGAFDAAPIARRILENTAEAVQSSPVWEQWTIAVGVVAIGTPPARGQTSWLRFAFDADGRISSLEFAAAHGDAIPIVVLAYKPATATQTGALTVEAVRFATSTGGPNQLCQLQGPELCVRSLHIYTLENGGPRRWSAVASFVASTAVDTHYIVEAGEAQILFGDGQNGRIPQAGVPIVGVARVLNGSAGNVAAGAIDALDSGPHNSAVLDVAGTAAKFQSIANPDPAANGAEQETIEHAEGRIALLVDRPQRAVTLADCEALAMETPGATLARAAAIANFCPGLQCYSASGFITVVIVPWLPVGRPVPSTGLIASVSSYLRRRCVVGTRIEVTGPEYLEVGVSASVRAVPGQSKPAVEKAIVAALNAFLDPLTGGPNRTGWPLGRGVYISEILDTIARVAGVDHVLALELQAAGCGPECGDVCLSPLALTVSGSHRIQVS